MTKRSTIRYKLYEIQDMIKTLRITSIVVVILAVVFFVFLAVFGVCGDEQTEQFLNSAGAIEEFNEARDDKGRKSESQISPLVKQAEAFALYLNPPPLEKLIAFDKPSITRKPPSVSAKFELIGTSFYPLHPELSLALIDEPGKGLRWVRQSSEVGHLIIEQVKDGLVVVKDGKRTFELVAERPEKRSLVKKPSGETAPDLIKSALGKGATDIAGNKAPQMSVEEEKASLKKAIDELKAVQADFESDKTDSKLSGEASAVLIEGLISNLEAKAMRISAEEARRLDHLGKELKDVQLDPNRAKDDRTESDANLSEPNLSEVNSPEEE